MMSFCSFGSLPVRSGWLLWITDGRANPLMDRKLVGMSNYLSVYLSIHPSIYPSFLSAGLSVCQPIHLSVFSIHLLGSLSVFAAVHPSSYFCPCVHLSIFRSTSQRSVHFLVSLPAKLLNFLWGSSSFNLTTSKRSNSARLPQGLNVVTSKTKQFCETPQVLNVATSKTKEFRETSLIFEVDNIKNQAIPRDFLQTWKIECRADGLVPLRFAIFPVYVSKVILSPYC